VGYGEPADLVEGGRGVTSLHSLPFVALIVLCVCSVRTWTGYAALGQLLITPFSSSLALALALALYPLLLVLVGHSPTGDVLRYGMVGIDVFVFWAWGILILGAHTTNMLGLFLVLELFNSCALIVMVLEGSTLDMAEKRGFPVVAEAVVIFFWISVFSAFISFWGLGLLVSAGVNVGGMIRVNGAKEEIALFHQLLLSGGMGLKGGIPPLGWWIFDFYSGLTADQLAAYVGAFYLPLVSLVLCIGIGVSGSFVGLGQLQRQGIAVGAVGLVLSVTEVRTIRGAVSVSTIVSLCLLGLFFV